MQFCSSGLGSCHFVCSFNILTEGRWILKIIELISLQIHKLISPQWQVFICEMKYFKLNVRLKCIVINYRSPDPLVNIVYPSGPFDFYIPL